MNTSAVYSRHDNEWCATITKNKRMVISRENAVKRKDKLCEENNAAEEKEERNYPNFRCKVEGM